MKKTLACLVILIPMFQTLSAQKTKVEKVKSVCEGLPLNKRVSIAVMNFEDKTNSSGASRGMAEMLTNAVVETNCFRVVERSRLSELLKEQSMDMSGAVNDASAQDVGNLTGAQLMIVGSLTEFKENESGGGLGGILPRRGLGGIIGGVGLIQAHVGFILRIVNTSTGDILFSKSLDHKINKVGAAGGGVFGGIPAGGLFYKSKAMQDAIEETLIEATDIIVKQKDNFAASLPPAASSNGSVGSSTPSPIDCSFFNKGKSKKVMVIIPEVHIRRRVPDPAGETEIIRKLIANGITVVDPSAIKALLMSENINYIVNSNDSLKLIGRRYGADIVIAGEAFSELSTNNSTNLGGMISCRARVEARAIQTSDGKILATNGQQAGAIDNAELIAGKKALAAAGAKMGDYFLSQLCKAGDQVQSSGMLPATPSFNTCEIVVNNINYNQLQNVVTFLKKYPKIKSINKDFSGKVARLTVEHDWKIDDIADILSKGNPGVPLEITGLDDNKIQVNVK